MSRFLGVDTSNYTTSLAIYDTVTNSITNKKALLPVKPGEIGLRQSDALFFHIKQISSLMNELFYDSRGGIDAIGVSVRPRPKDDSYMPCFLAGKAVAECCAVSNCIPVYHFSHQEGHITAALFSAGRLDLIDSEFIAFHVSGGTTDVVKVTPSENSILKIEEIATSLDLKAGQLIDRVGNLLGLPFPAGPYIENEAKKSFREFKIRPTLKELNCCLSGVENQCKRMLDDGICSADIAHFCIDSVCSAIKEMAIKIRQIHPNVPIVFSGGVMSNVYIRNSLKKSLLDVYFAEPEFSSDNATGIALLASIRMERQHER